MLDKYSYKVGDIVKMKKPHPCGEYNWLILRTGIDFRLKCLKCERLVMIPRPKFEKGVKSVVSGSQDENSK
ncbi:DUF951 domain-containing protein [Selenomonadales bacterium OttesenSCG-928-I06]|nr:DUF951 domain-containing protein [Selenomonadales bacterium OttesenSCG-928-I06]